VRTSKSCQHRGGSAIGGSLSGAVPVAVQPQARATVRHLRVRQDRGWMGGGEPPQLSRGGGGSVRGHSNHGVKEMTSGRRTPWEFSSSAKWGKERPKISAGRKEEGPLLIYTLDI